MFFVFCFFPESGLKVSGEGVQCDNWGGAVVKEDLLVCRRAGLWDWQGNREGSVLEGEQCVWREVWSYSYLRTCVCVCVNMKHVRLKNTFSCSSDWMAVRVCTEGE